MTRRDEKGFSLAEVLVTVVIAGVLVVVMADATIIGLRTIDNTNDRLAGSNDTMLVTSYFTGDVDSADAISTTGAVEHSAPSVNVATANSLLVGFWGLRSWTALSPPTAMSEVWDLPTSAGTPGCAATSVNSSMADGLVSEVGPSFDRVAESAAGTSSIAHSVVLSPTAPIVWRGETHGCAVNAASFTLVQPASLLPGDALLAHLVVRGQGVTVTGPAGWRELDARAVSDLTSLVYEQDPASTEPLAWTWTFSGDADVAGGVAQYGNVEPTKAHANNVNPCGGDTPVLLLSWHKALDATGSTERHEVTYNAVQDGAESTLVRRHCTANSGTPVDEQELARRLASTAPTDVFADCRPVACGPLSSPIEVHLTIREKLASREATQREYEMRATTRTNR